MKYINALILIFSVTAAYAEDVKKKVEFELLPSSNIYDAPIADPRWAKFSTGLSRDYKGNLGKGLWSFTFGENIALARFGSESKPYEVGIQAATFGVMDIRSNPTRLINQDYFIGLGLSHRAGNIQHLFQLSHVSSHVGDEFLLSKDGKNLNRINLSYETLKWYGRYKNPELSFSPYVSVGYMVHVDPAHIKRLVVGTGLDYHSKKIIFDNSTRLIVGADFSAWQENSYKGTLTIRAGLQYERTKYCNRYMQLLLQYKQGKSQMGQFYGVNIRSVGLLVVFSS